MGKSYYRRPFCLGRHSYIGSSPAGGRSAMEIAVPNWEMRDDGPDKIAREARRREMMADPKSTKRIRGAGLLENSVGEEDSRMAICG